MNGAVLLGSSSPPDKGQGINSYVNSIGEELTRRGIKVVYAAPPAGGGNEKQWPFVHVPVGQHDRPIDAAKRLLDAIHRHNVSLIINSDNPYLQNVAPWVNCVFISVGHLIDTNMASLACYNNKWIDYVVTISSDMQRRFISKYRLDPARVPIIYNGVADPYGGNLPERSTGNSLKLVFVGGMNHRKGADLVLSAVSGGKIVPGVDLHWFGHVPERARKRLNNTPGVIMHGRVSRQQILNALVDADVFLLPSRREGCPMAMLEAMSFGVIPIASDGAGAMDRLITHGQEGFICRLSHWDEDMRRCLDYLQKYPERTSYMRDMVYRRFRVDFQVQHTVERLLSLGETPVCFPRSMPERVRMLKWHRPLEPRTGKAPLLDRVAIRTGRLRRSSTVSYEEIVSGR